MANPLLPPNLNLEKILLIKLENITRVSKVKSVVDFNTRLRGYRVKSVVVFNTRNTKKRVVAFNTRLRGLGGRASTPNARPITT